MHIQPKFIVFIVFGVSVSCLISLSTAATHKECSNKCFDCSRCDYNCYQECGSALSSILCKLTTERCRADHGCDAPSTNITIYPANDFNAGKDPALQPLTLQLRKNCCYELSGYYDKTLSNIKNNDACVNLYSGHGCTGNVLKVDTSFPCPKSKTGVITLDCPARLSAKGPPFNDKTSSIRLC